MADSPETIFALSSPPPGSGGLRAILRLSGGHAWPLIQHLADLPNPVAGYYPIAAKLTDLVIPHCAVLLFRAPRSFTGEDIAELQLPNSPPLLRAIIDTLLLIGHKNQLPLREALPGEFSARAFFNGKIDLTEAEGIAATIHATDQRQLRAAAAMRHGATFRWMHAAAEEIAELLARLEAGLDFADEADITFITPAQLAVAAQAIQHRIEEALRLAARADPSDALPTIVFTGLPNAGKSSLINALCGTDRSIVSNIPGTTRDALLALLHTPTGTLRLIDLPGTEAPTDALRAAMMQTRTRALLEADVLIEVRDATFPQPAPTVPEEEAFCERILLLNKADLLPSPLPDPPADPTAWGYVSAKTGLNLEALRDELSARALQQPAGSGLEFALNHRHRLILRELRHTLQSIAERSLTPDLITRHPELLAADLRLALDSLAQITGAITPDDILSRVFSRFCIGK